MAESEEQVCDANTHDHTSWQGEHNAAWQYDASCGCLTASFILQRDYFTLYLVLNALF